MYGEFIVLEGPDGVGKSTQVERITKHLNQHGYATISTREPHDNFVGRTIRAILKGTVKMPDPIVMATLFSAARMIHCEKVIRPALEKGINVVCDRYIFSTFAYNLSPELTKEQVEELHADFYITPDHVFYLDCETAMAGLRMAKRNAHSVFDLDIEKMIQVRTNYYKMFTADLSYAKTCIEVCGKLSDVHWINAQNNVDKVFTDICRVLDGRMAELW